MKTYVVTGVSSGIGAALATALLERGDAVIGLGRRSLEYRPTNRFEFVEVDFTNRVQTERALGALKKSLDHLDGVVSNAGVGLFGQVENHRGAHVFDLVDVNFTSHILLARALLPIMKFQKDGTFVFIGSEAAHQGRRNGAVYCATKAAIKAFAQGLRQDVANSGVRVCLVNPGMVDTPFFDTLPFRPGRKASQHLTADQVVDAILVALDAPVGMVVDEISMSPQVNVIEFETKKES